MAEAEAIRRYTTGKSSALLFDDFQSIGYQGEKSKGRSKKYKDWEVFDGKAINDSRVLKLDANMKMATGDSTWDNYLLEAVVMLKETYGNAGLIFRVEDIQNGQDKLHSYYVGFNSKTLTLGKFDNGWKELKKYDLSLLDCKVEAGVWNMIRVEAKGNQFKIYFNSHASFRRQRQRTQD